MGAIQECNYNMQCARRNMAHMSSLCSLYDLPYSGKFLYGANFHTSALYAKIKTTKI